MYILLRCPHPIAEVQKILLFRTKNNITYFLIISSDAAYLADPTQKPAEGDATSATVQEPTSMSALTQTFHESSTTNPAHSSNKVDGIPNYGWASTFTLGISSTNDRIHLRVGPQQPRNEWDQIMPPTPTSNISIGTTTIHKPVEESNMPIPTATPGQVATPPPPISPEDFPVNPTNPTEAPSIDHSMLEDDHSGGEGSSPLRAGEWSNSDSSGPQRTPLAFNESVVVSESASDHETKTSMDGGTQMERQEHTNEYKEPLTPSPQSLTEYESASSSTTLTDSTMFDDSDPSHPSSLDLPVKEEPTQAATAAEFYRVDALNWERFASASAPGTKLSNWASGKNGRGRVSTQRQEGDDGEQSRKLYPQHSSVLLHEREDDIRKGETGVTMRTREKDSCGQDKEPRISLFEHSEYPPPWPLVPFSQTIPQYIEHHIPHQFLPKSLVVHDPWNMLAVDSYNDHGYAQKSHYGEWMEREDIVHEYDLELSSAAQTHDPVKDESGDNRADAVKVPLLQVPKMNVVTPPAVDGEINSAVVLTVADAMKSPSGYLFFPENIPPGPTYPPIFITFDLPPHESPLINREPRGIDTAHLYIDANNFINYGHHSSVLEAELELPRSSIIYPENMDSRPKLCVTCIKKDLKEKLASLDGEHGEGMAERWKEKSAMIKRTSIPDGCEEKNGTFQLDIEGPVRTVRIALRMHDYNSTECEYANPPPPSTRVRLVAKLSNLDDTHLDREAENYQSFPQHMFEHWNSTYTLPNGNGSVPMGAVVPQFYGYYSPRRKHNLQKEGYYQQRGQYLSRILLLEYSGKQITMDKLTLKEKKQCASLVARIHDAGWSHESIFRRNFVWKAGPINVRRSKRGEEKIFRLVDFGRSYHKESGLESSVGYESWEESRTEDRRDVEKLFGVSLSRNASDTK